MARARNIKPSFFTNDELANCEPIARLLFIGLWTIADREGRLEDRPKKIKAELFPYDNIDCDKLLTELQKRNFIERYQTKEGGSYIAIPKFLKHQNPHCREAESTIPAPCEHSANTVRARLIPDSGFLIPDSLILNPDSLNSDMPEISGIPLENRTQYVFPLCVEGTAWMLSKHKLNQYSQSFPSIDINLELLNARQWLLDNPTRKKTKSGMCRYLGTWLAKAQNSHRGNGSSPTFAQQRVANTQKAIKEFSNG